MWLPRRGRSATCHLSGRDAALSKLASQVQRALAARFNLRGNQTDLIYSRGMRDVNHIGHVRERDGVIALHEHDFLGAGFIYIGQTPLQVVPGSIFLIDLEAGILNRAALEPN